MDPITLDCKGLACPGPVLRCLDCIEKDAPTALNVIVDDAGALENVLRLLGGKGYTVEVLQDMGAWSIEARRDGGQPAPKKAPVVCAAPAAHGKTLVFLTAETIGGGDDELGGKLMLNFLATLPELGSGLWRVILVNGAVKLATQGHPCLEKLTALAASGVSILVCGTCLSFFGLMELKAVGETTNMLDVVTSLSAAGKVIQL
ncbi:MAG: sulfurtransferase-like selenium metabolism protein YedF [Desulfovibrio sp.]|jgi:selenium metabolism protein YedF